MTNKNTSCLGINTENYSNFGMLKIDFIIGKSIKKQVNKLHKCNDFEIDE